MGKTAEWEAEEAQANKESFEEKRRRLQLQQLLKRAKAKQEAERQAYLQAVVEKSKDEEKKEKVGKEGEAEEVEDLEKNEKVEKEGREEEGEAHHSPSLLVRHTNLALCGSLAKTMEIEPQAEATKEPQNWPEEPQNTEVLQKPQD